MDFYLDTKRQFANVYSITMEELSVLSYAYENKTGSKDWSDSITLDLQDGETYYIQLVSGDIKYKIKELTEKEYQKRTKKIKDFEVNPDYVDEN